MDRGYSARRIEVRYPRSRCSKHFESAERGISVLLRPTHSLRAHKALHAHHRFWRRDFHCERSISLGHVFPRKYRSEVSILGLADLFPAPSEQIPRFSVFPRGERATLSPNRYLQPSHGFHESQHRASGFWSWEERHGAVCPLFGCS